MPRCSSSSSIPARFTAVRWPATACATAAPPECRPRTRSLRCCGNSSTSSSVRTEPETSVPVTTVPKPFITKARSIGRRKWRVEFLPGADFAAPSIAAFSASRPAPVFALTSTIGAPSRNEPRTKSSTSSLARPRTSGSARSDFVSAITPLRIPSRRQISKCSRVCGFTLSSAATTSSTRSMPPAPASILRTKRSWPGTSTKPMRISSRFRNAKPISMVMPRRFSSSRRSGCVPVSAATRADLP